MKKFNNISTTDISNAINEWIHHKRNREILYDRLIDGMLFEELAEKYHLSVQQVKTIVYKGTDTIFEHLEVKE